MALTQHVDALTTAPLPSATVMLLRDSPVGLQVLLLRRHSAATDLGGVYVFPGGKLEAHDLPQAGLHGPGATPSVWPQRLGEPDLDGRTATGLAVAALRETLEECGLLPGQPLTDSHRQELRRQLQGGQSLLAALASLGLPLALDHLWPWARWITPRQGAVTRKRFDTRFFVAVAQPGQEPQVDDFEATEAVWTTPNAALQRYASGAMDLAPPQILSLYQLGPMGSAAAALDHARAQVPRCIEPVVASEGEQRYTCFPGDPLHTQPQEAWVGPTRLRYHNGRFVLPAGWGVPPVGE